MIKKIGFILGPLLFLLIFLFPIPFLDEQASRVIAAASWMVLWWITDAVNISITALIPLVIFPVVGIGEMTAVAAKYGSPIVYLFFGGFVMALALEKVQLHKRIALNIIRFTGLSPDRIVLGFMIATAFLSMWISNTATTVVMLPIAYSVIALIVNDMDGFTKNDKNFALSIMLGIAFSANVGGVATLIGTPPNIVLAGFLESEYDIELSFVNWMMFGFPFSVVMIGFIYMVLVKWMYPNNLTTIENSSNVINSELKKLGPISNREMFVSFVFLIAIFLWMFKSYVNDMIIPFTLSDTSISLLAAFALFVIPQNGKFSLEWEDTKNLPWGILILFGGGLALASAMSEAGIINLIGDTISSSERLSVFMVASLLIAVMLFMTELMSNVALIAIFAPVVAGIAIGLDSSILHMLIPVTMASSCAFMLPMATPPNAIVFASGHIQVHQMARAGIFLNVISIILLIGFFKLVIPLIVA